MKIDELRLYNFRNYDQITIKPHEGINLFFGKNGSGKTNLLEAIHFCALGKSHRISNDQNIVRIGENEGMCSVSVQNSSSKKTIQVRLQPAETQKKTILIDQKKIHRFSDMMGCLQCVIFSPEDLDLIKEGPSVRRKYLDMMISQISKNYFVALQQYRNAMEQRNAILRTLKNDKRDFSAMLTDFEEAMAVPAAVIVRERERFSGILSEYARSIYRKISNNEEELNIGYHTGIRDKDDIAGEMIKELKENRTDDIRYGITSFGPHRDDLLITLNRKGMKTIASQGQIRTAALSMKLSQMSVLKEQSGESPVLLLDDVMSELDKGRRMRLLEEIGNTQTFITCTDESDLDDCTEKRTYAVSSENGIGSIYEVYSGQMTEEECEESPDFT